MPVFPRSENGKTVFDVDPAEFAEDMKIFAEEAHGLWAAAAEQRRRILRHL